MQCGVECAFFDFEQLLGGLVNPLGDGISMKRTAGDGLEDKHLESAGNEFAWGGVFFPKHIRGKIDGSVADVKCDRIVDVLYECSVEEEHEVLRKAGLSDEADPENNLGMVSVLRRLLDTLFGQMMGTGFTSIWIRAERYRSGRSAQ